jgi:hypothetical protein
MVNQLEHATEALRKALVQVERLKTQTRALLERSGEPIAVVTPVASTRPRDSGKWWPTSVT